MKTTKRNVSNDVITLALMCALSRDGDGTITPKKLADFMSYNGFEITIYKARKVVSEMGGWGVITYNPTSKAWRVNPASLVLRDISMAFHYANEGKS
jgi:hypothetical protein